MTFAKGASLRDPAGLFNSSLEGSTRRAIDLHEGDPIDEEALQALVRAAAELHTSSTTATQLARGARQVERGEGRIARDAGTQSGERPLAPRDGGRFSGEGAVTGAGRAWAGSRTANACGREGRGASAATRARAATGEGRRTRACEAQRERRSRSARRSVERA